MASFNTLASESTNSMISGLQSSDDSDSFYSSLSSLSSLDFNSDTEEESEFELQMNNTDNNSSDGMQQGQFFRVLHC